MNISKSPLHIPSKKDKHFGETSLLSKSTNYYHPRYSTIVFYTSHSFSLALRELMYYLFYFVNMNILVCIAKVPDTTTKISFADNNTKFNTERVQWVINPLDEFALTRAIELKEVLGGTITVISVGKADTEPLIRKAFAIGADEGIRVDADPTDCFFTGSQIAHYAKEGNYDFIFAGRETTDYEGAQVGGIVAELMGIPFIAGVPKFDFDGNLATLEREVEGGKEKITVKPPFLASIQEGVTEPRIPSMRGIMSARTKPLKVVPAVEAGSYVGVEHYELPPPKGACKYVEAENAGQLIELLHKEAKAL